LETRQTDVVVVGAGNAAMSAAHRARELGLEVVVVERAPVRERGGNSAYTSGAMRVSHNGVDDLIQLMPDMSQAELDNSDFGTYPAELYYDDLAAVSQYRADPDMADLLARESFPTLLWMKEQGIRFLPQFGRQAFKVGGKHKFWGEPVGAAGGGAGLVEEWHKLATKAGITIEYETRAMSLLTERGRVTGVVCTRDGDEWAYNCGAVILACGGFEANAEWRARYLGKNWDLAKVRGTRYNTGDGIRMALAIGATPHGNWSGCHAVGWDRNAPDYGDVTVGDGFNKHNYPLSIMVNAEGNRFVDEGADLRNKTYAKYGRMVLEQPGQFAWQIFDAKTAELLLHEFYRHRQVTRAAAGTLDELVTKLDGVDADQCLATIREYNAAPRSDAEFNPAIKDGLATTGLAIPKSNWALRIDEPPFEAFAVTCGVTFTFGGLKVNLNAQVLDQEDKPIGGLYAAGELVAGLFYHNYPGGTGLTWGAVMGKRAGQHAAASVAPTPAR
jgi:tricarballylate dehydrogenase